MKETPETINWIAVDRALPDDDTTVLVFNADCDDPVWPGYHSDGKWFYAEILPAPNISHWAHLPEGPTP